VVVETYFDVIFGSHCLEHQVDLIGHLQSLTKLLKPGGRVIEIIPDLRRCFDLLRYPSVTADVLLPHLRRAPIHQGKQAFDTLARELDINPGRLPTEGELAQAAFARPLDEAYQAMRAAEQSGAAYRDLHAWTFTPESFRLLLLELRLLGLVDLQARLVSPAYDNQFCVVLEPIAGELDRATVQALEAERLELAKRLRVPG
jgi:SAM-dependent methyltransferase